MGGDHHDYVRPKTDGTFGLRTNWSLLSQSRVASTPASVKLPQLEPVTRELLESKTLREWWYWRSWRRSSPLAQLSPGYLWKAYQAKYLSGAFPHGSVLKHWFVGLAVLGFVANYSSNVNGHLYAKHH